MTGADLRRRMAMLRWHRRVGVSAALVLIVIALSGMLLLNADALSLTQAPVRWPLLHRWYGLQTPEVRAVQLGAQTLVQIERGLWLDNKLIAEPAGHIAAAVQSGAQIYVASDQDFSVFQMDGQRIEVLDRAQAYPTGVTALAAHPDGVLLVTGDGQWLYRLEAGAFEPFAGAMADTAPALAPLTGETAAPWVKAHHAQSLRWGRVLQDLHSGRLFGTAGVWIANLASVIFLFLAGSGFWLWWKRQHRRPE